MHADSETIGSLLPYGRPSFCKKIHKKMVFLMKIFINVENITIYNKEEGWKMQWKV